MTPSGRWGGRALPWTTATPSLLLAQLVLVAGIALRFLYLDADPHYYEWWGYITDEGRWVTHARELALFGRVLSTDWTMHLLLAPIFQASSYAAFELFGVNIFAARFLTAVCGSGILLAAWFLLRRVVTPPALLLAMVVLAFDWDLLVLSRLAIPEVPVMLVHLLVFALLTSDRMQRGNLLLAGLVEGVAIGIKATALPVAAVWVLVIAARRVREGDPRSTWTSVAWYLSSLAAPALVGGIAAALCCFDRLAGILANVLVLPSFVATTSPYEAIAFFFESTLAPSFGSWALAFWLATLGRLTGNRDTASDRQARYFDAALLWCLSYTALMLSLSYFPSRYKVHVIVPIAICIGVGVSMLRAGVAAVGVAASQHRRSIRVAIAAWLALPTAAMLAPGLTHLAWLGGLEPMQLRVKVACLASVLAVMTWITLRRAFEAATVRALLLFPVTGTLAWLALREFVGGPFWYGDEAWSVWHWSVAIGAAAIVVGASRPLLRVGTIVVTGAVVYMILSLVRIAPGYLAPRYTIRDASVALGELLSDYPGAVATIDGEGLFNENQLQYASIVEPTLGPARPDALVVVGEIDDPADVLAREYSIVATYPLYVAPEYSDSVVHHGEGLFARVLRRRADGAQRLDETATRSGLDGG